jgi:hypothetical protein
MRWTLVYTAFGGGVGGGESSAVASYRTYYLEAVEEKKNHWFFSLAVRQYLDVEGLGMRLLFSRLLAAICHLLRKINLISKHTLYSVISVNTLATIMQESCYEYPYS